MGLEIKTISLMASEAGLVLSSAAAERIVEAELDCKEIFSKAKRDGEWMISPEYVDSFIPKNQPDVCTPSVEVSQISDGPVTLSPRAQPKSCEIEDRLKIHDESDVTGKSTCAGKIEDFVAYFNKKFENIKGVLMERIEYKSAMTIDSLRKAPERQNVQTIVMINGKRESRNGKKFLDVEDPTGTLTVLVPQDRDEHDQLKAVYDRLLPDEVVGLDGVLLGDLFIVRQITQPDIPLNHNPRYADEQVYAVFLSDIHVGSYLFLENEFNQFIEWINLRGANREMAERVKYICIAGDLVDGIGIYPDQEKELTIPDIKAQYEFLALLLAEIPKNVKIIACMGNHDAVRNAEPQPVITQDLAPGLYALENLHLTGNPIKFSLHGVEILMYHGTSLDSVIGNLSGCSYSQPQNAMIEYLKRRSLIPTYGPASISPEREDFLFIGEVPDIFHCGHVHTIGYTQYRGVNIINSGTFQAKTAFQERLGHQPTPALVPIINLQNHEVSMLDFNRHDE